MKVLYDSNLIRVRFFVKAILSLTLLTSCFYLHGCTTIKPPPRDRSGVKNNPDCKAYLSYYEFSPANVVNPTYPMTQFNRGQEGWVIVGFTLEPDGSTSSLYIEDSSPEQVFDSAALKAVNKYVYRSKVDNPPVTTGCIVIEFSIDHALKLGS